MQSLKVRRGTEYGGGTRVFLHNAVRKVRSAVKCQVPGGFVGVLVARASSRAYAVKGEVAWKPKTKAKGPLVLDLLGQWDKFSTGPPRPPRSDLRSR